eukprot:TRINITY_DN10688_c0_g1_i1.p1 TRINITY_DN10688_c0_g1~~TRINITY_DN10688_c0_g1_i1.p1  ORF type:complete len:114 (+),score=2.30 TRINITY_DN10688_c0_g1_i1:1114-1455(+)
MTGPSHGLSAACTVPSGDRTKVSGCVLQESQVQWPAPLSVQTLSGSKFLVVCYPLLGWVLHGSWPTPLPYVVCVCVCVVVEWSQHQSSLVRPRCVCVWQWRQHQGFDLCADLH